jgi:hypothetical protein
MGAQISRSCLDALILREKDWLGIFKVNRRFFGGVVNNGRMSTMSTTRTRAIYHNQVSGQHTSMLMGMICTRSCSDGVYPFIAGLKSCNKSTRVPSPPAPSLSRHSSGHVCTIPYFTVSDRTVYGFHVHNLWPVSPWDLQLAISINSFLLTGFQLSSLLLRR